MKRKTIDLQAARKAIDSFDEENTASLVDFIAAHFENLKRSRRSLREKYDLLRSCDLDVGTFQSFRATYYLVKKRRAGEKMKSDPKETKPYSPVALSGETSKTEIQKRKTTDVTSNAGLRPITLPDGTPVEIDPETGAKTFKI